MSVKFSIIIPTRERHDTLPYAIQSVLDQTYHDFELIVMDNCSSIQTQEVVASFTDDRIKYYRSPMRLSMDRNWELGIGHASGEYLFVLGDDDAMLPDGLELVERLLHKYPVKIVSWYRWPYFWENSQVEHRQNKLMLELKQNVNLLTCRQALINFYRSDQMYEYLPMIYNSFVHREVILNIIRIHGNYLLPFVPDVASGIINAYYCDSFIYSFKSISLAGISKHSTGTSAAYQSLDSQPFNTYLKELELAAENKKQDFHADLIYSKNLEITVGNCALLTKDYFFPNDDGIQLDIKMLLNHTAKLINRDSDRYDLTLEEIKLIAQKHNIPIHEIDIPGKEAESINIQEMQGVHGNNYGVERLVVNCEQNGVKDANAAAKLAQSIWNNIDDLRIEDKRILTQNSSVVVPRVSDRPQITQNKKTKIGFDISVLGLGHVNQRARTGIFRVVHNILKESIAADEFDLCLCARLYPLVPWILNACKAYLAAEFPNINSHVFTIPELRQQNISLYHSPFHPLPDEIFYCQRMITIYDLIPVKYPHFFSDGEDHLIKKTITSATDNDLFLCISEATKQDLLEYAPQLAPERAIVTHLAADKEKFYPCEDRVKIEKIRQKYQISDGRYLLSVCTLEPRKNLVHTISCFLKAIEEKSIADLNLVLVGTKGWQFDEIFAEIDKNHNLSHRIIFTGFVPDEDLAPLYSEALGFLYLSHYEGFGLPPLEAMQCGTPVITSNNSSLPEVVGDAGITLDSKDVNGLCNAIFELYSKPELKQNLSLRSLDRAAEFSWQKTIEATIDVYRQLAVKPELNVAAPKIIIDAVFFQLYNTGIARVWRSLLAEWANTEFGNHLVILDRAGTAPKIDGINYYQIPAYDYNNTDADRQMLQQICDDLGADLFISTYYTTPLETPSVFMGYDMIPEVLGFDLNQPMWQEKQRAIAHASAHINISEHTAQDLVELYSNVDPIAVSVAHCGVSDLFKPAHPKNLAEFRTKYGISRPYFMMGAPGGYKNTELFLQALDRLPNKSSFDLIVTGGHVMSEEYRRYTYGCNVHYLRLDDVELSLAYAGAIALVYPSKYEGFGLPIVEAMASGCPVITCPNASIPEVAGEAALYVFDEDVDGMAEALCEVQKPQVRSALIAAGWEQAKQFSWTTMADTVKSVLIERTLSHLPLSDRNYIIFPDWSQDEEVLGEEIAEICYNLAQNSNGDRQTLVIDTAKIEDPELAMMLVSGIAMNLTIVADLDISEYLEIALTDRLAPIQWQALLPNLQGRIKLECEDLSAIVSAGAQLLPEIQLAEAPELATV